MGFFTTKQEEYEQGQNDGSQASTFEQVVHSVVRDSLGGDRDSAYEKGYDNGTDNQPQENSATAYLENLVFGSDDSSDTEGEDSGGGWW